MSDRLLDIPVSVTRSALGGPPQKGIEQEGRRNRRSPCILYFPICNEASRSFGNSRERKARVNEACRAGRGQGKRVC